MARCGYLSYLSLRKTNSSGYRREQEEESYRPEQAKYAAIYIHTHTYIYIAAFSGIPTTINPPLSSLASSSYRNSIYFHICSSIEAGFGVK